jgi:Cd2+/Zn2+-exporting ATPase
MAISEGGPMAVGSDRISTESTMDAAELATAREPRDDAVHCACCSTTVEQPRKAPAGVSFWARRARVVLTGASGALLALGVALGWLGVASTMTVPLLVASSIAGGWYVLPRGLRAMRHRALDMHALMSIAAVGAGAIGQWGEAASALFLFAIAQLLESYSLDRARNAIAALMDISPPEATVHRAGGDVIVPVADVAIGETIRIKPGERIPLDGVVLAGRSAVDQAPITGESIPVDKEPGAEVFAGSINAHGALEVRVTRHAEDTTLARIIHAVEEAQSKRAPSQAFVDRFARVYTPAVVALALLIAILPPLLFGAAWSIWIYRSLAMLVVACPCALVISTPVTIVSGLAGAARAGILIKGGLFLEHIGRVTVVALDKTGTLTRGRPAVVDVIATRESSEGEVLRLAAGVERHSEHPLARAVLDEATARGIVLPPSTAFEALPALGARASIEERVVYLGNASLMRERGLTSSDVRAVLDRLEQEGRTPVLVATDDALLGVIAIADRVRPEARGAIAALLDQGIRPVMLTGDTEGTARSVATQVGISDVHARLMPDDKVRLVRDLEARRERVAFVGDGVNDAPALATATVGAAMGAAGTDVALETADVALMADDLEKLPLAVQLSRRALGIIQQNVVFAIAIKVVFLVLAASGVATLWMAVAADMGASLVVIANGLRALHVERRGHFQRAAERIPRAVRLA